MALRNVMFRRKWSRLLIYWLDRLFSPDLLREAAMLGLFAAASRVSGCRVYRGIRVLAQFPHRFEALEEIVEALELIRKADPRRFARVEMSVRRIELANWKTRSGFYHRLGRVCGVKKLSQEQQPKGLVTHHYAAIIVHEATHGMLAMKGIPQTRGNRARIERLCVREEARFLAKFPDEAREIVAFCDASKARQLVSRKRETHCR